MEIKSQGCIKSYSFQGKDLSRIVFYGHGVEHQEVDRGWLDYTREDGHSVDLVSIEIDEPVRAVKVNLSRTDNYILKDHKARYSFDKGHVLYIHAAPVETQKVFRSEDDLKADYVERCLYRIAGTLRYPLRFDDGREPAGRVDSIWIHKKWITEPKPFKVEVEGLVRDIEARTRFEGRNNGLKMKEDEVALLLKHYDVKPRKEPRGDPDRKGPPEE